MADKNMLSQIFSNILPEQNLQEKIQEATRAKDLGHISQDTYLKTVESLVNQLPKTSPLSEISFPQAERAQVEAPKPVVNAPAPMASEPAVARPSAEAEMDDISNTGNVVPTGVNAGVRDSVQSVSQSLGGTPLDQYMSQNPQPDSIPLEATAEIPSSPTSSSKPLSTNSMPEEPIAIQQAAPSRKDAFLDRVLGAEKSDVGRNLMNDLGRASEKIGAGIAQQNAYTPMKPDTEYYDAQLKDANKFKNAAIGADKQLTDFDKRRAEEGQSQFDVQKFDPNSELSKNAREVFKAAVKKANVNIPVSDNASLAELEKEYTWMKDLMAIEAKKLDRSESRANRDALMSIKRSDKAHEITTKAGETNQKVFNDFQQKTLAPIELAESMISQVKNKNSFAPVTLQYQLAKMAQGAGVLSDKEITMFGGNRSLLESLKAKGKLLEDGGWTDLNIKDAEVLIKAYKYRAENKLSDLIKPSIDRTHNSAINYDSGYKKSVVKSILDPAGIVNKVEARKIAEKRLAEVQKKRPDITLDQRTEIFKKELDNE